MVIHKSKEPPGHYADLKYSISKRYMVSDSTYTFRDGEEMVAPSYRQGGERGGKYKEVARGILVVMNRSVP